MSRRAPGTPALEFLRYRRGFGTRCLLPALASVFLLVRGSPRSVLNGHPSTYSVSGNKLINPAPEMNFVSVYVKE